MGMNRPAGLALCALVAVGATAAPAVAKSKPPKPLKGTWSYTDTTPDPSSTANSDASSHCHGKLPAAPTDVNSHTLTVKRAGLLTVVGHNKLDWAMEIRDKKGNVLTGSDGTSPTSPEGSGAFVRPGTYTVVYCNMEGEPTITASYTFVFH